MKEKGCVRSIFKTNLQNNVERLRADSVQGVVDLMVCLHYSVYGMQCHMRSSVTFYPISRRVLGYIDD